MNKHELTIGTPVNIVDHGLILGNGDISASFYQGPSLLIWRLGKGDVWDRRLDYHLDPKPAHIEEIARGVTEEGWIRSPYGRDIKALKGTDNPERVYEICASGPPSHSERPYPCPKPVGELIMHIPADWSDMRFKQTLVIEDALLRVECSWSNGVKLYLEVFIAPDDNVLGLDWTLTGWDYQTATGEMYVAPVWFALYRKADPGVAEFGEDYCLKYNPIFNPFNKHNCLPLEKPFVNTLNGHKMYLQQNFYPEPTFPDGFCYGIMPVAANLKMTQLDAGSALAGIRLTPELDTMSGKLFILVESAECDAALGMKLQDAASVDVEVLALDSKKAANAFWQKSAVKIADKLVENLWYEVLHVRRCTCKSGKLPPGLFLPSTVQDYSLWHGDYHFNYNFQQPFLGDYAANHFEIGDSYFDVMRHVLQLGKIISERYYDCRGTFVQLTNFPVMHTDDNLGIAPMGRMAYMTGWAGHQYYWRYHYSMDKEWLRNEGYPVLRELALFYTDFLQKGEDGLYHAFPSCQGEDGFTGIPDTLTDVAQVMLHIRFALCAALEAAQTLEVDVGLQEDWGDRINNLAGINRMHSRPQKAVEKWDDMVDDLKRLSREPRIPWQEITATRGDFFPPEFLGFDGNIRNPDPTQEPEFNDPGFCTSRWYPGKLPLYWLTELRNRTFIPERDWPQVRNSLEKWRTPNGLLCAMSVNMYGYPGAWSEATGIIAPIQECLLSGHDGIIRIFPFAPEAWGDIRFDNLRTEGAFLVSAKRESGKTTYVKIISEKGGTLSLFNPFGREKVKIDGAEVRCDEKFCKMDMEAGQSFEITLIQT